MHIKWIPTVENVSELSPHNNEQGKKATGELKGITTDRKSISTKHPTLHEKVVCLHGLDIIHGERLFFMNFIFLLFLKKKNERWLENEGICSINILIFWILDVCVCACVHAHARAHQVHWNCKGCRMWAGIVFWPLSNSQSVLCNRSVPSRGKPFSKALCKLLTGITWPCKREKGKAW